MVNELANIAHVRSRKTFYHIPVKFRNPGFHSFQSPENQFLFSEPVRPLAFMCYSSTTRLSNDTQSVIVVHVVTFVSRLYILII